VNNALFNVYYGGSFDPPHLGHYEILSSLLKDPWTHRVHLVPTGQNPLKNNQNLDLIWASKENRWHWFESLIQDLKNNLEPQFFDKLSVQKIEFEKTQASYTIDTLSELKTNSEHRSHPWALAIGSDLLASLTHWKNIHNLLQNLDAVWIFLRNDENFNTHLIHPSLKAHTTFRLMNEKITSISSSEIRESQLNQISMWQNKISPQVYQSLLQSVHSSNTSA
jgi:nicotinate-nucleotide adenylyltransferase